MKKVLWLASWYPNAAEPFSGDFIKRQAEAASIYQPLTILFVGKYLTPLHSGTVTPDIKCNESGSMEENILYYSSPGNSNTTFSKIRSLYTYFKKHAEYIKRLRKSDELPDLVHVQVAMKAGLIALFMKWKYKIPYVITEHWSGYFEGTKDSLFQKSYLIRYLTRLILKNASRLLPVSDSLGNQIRNHWTNIPFQKIPNVVNTRYFYPSVSQPEGSFRFIHISTLLYPKNPEGIIRSFSRLLSQGFQANLVLVGPLNPAIQEMIQSTGAHKEQIHCTGEISYEQVGAELRKSSALVMFSLYETMSCVVIEALCSGIPVIATRVGGIPEVVGNENGILINAGNETELLQAMKEMITTYQQYKRENISRQASAQFSYETIGRKITQVYDEVIKKG